VPVGEVDAERAVGATGCVDDGARLAGRAGERLLAEHGAAALERGDRLLGVERARRRD